MKKWNGALVLAVTVLMVFAGFVGPAAAFKVNLISEIDVPAQVELRDVIPRVGAGQTLTQTLPPHGTYTFDTGAKCPVWVAGDINVEGQETYTVRCIGAEDANTKDCKPACFDTTYKLFKRVERGYVTYRWERQY